MSPLPPTARAALALRPGEEVINSWQPTDLLVLTNQRLLLVEVKGVFTKSYVMKSSRGLETLAEPAVKGGGPEYVLVVAGESYWFQGTDAHAARDEIAQARLLRLAQLGLDGSGQRAGASYIREKEVITRELVRIPCRYCGQLIDQTATRCPSCSAPLT